MPYIKQSDRESIDSQLSLPHIGGPGELNYIVTKIALKYLDQHGTNYANINDVVGALECCKLEFYRRLAVPYEEKKIAQNGDLEF